MAKLTASQEQELRHAFDLFDAGMLIVNVPEKLRKSFF